MGLAKVERESGWPAVKVALGKAADDEPVFILRAQDMHAPELVEAWANLAEGTRCSPEKVAEARALARMMRDWPNRKLSRLMPIGERLTGSLLDRDALPRQESVRGKLTLWGAYRQQRRDASRKRAALRRESRGNF